MSRVPTKNKINDDGLRFKAKVGGSPFPDASHFHKATMSCFLCGKHRPITHMKKRQLLGKTHNVCAPTCNEPSSE